MSGGACSNSALKLGNTQKIKFYDTNGSSTAQIYEDDANILNIANDNTIQITPTNGNLHLGDLSAAVEANAAVGFPILPLVSGAPTGTPIGLPAAGAPIIYDYVDDKLWAYNGSWRSVMFGASPIDDVLSTNVNLNNTSNYFDGPSVAQGSAGTWFVSGTVTIYDSNGSATIEAKLWDGTTVIASTSAQTQGQLNNVSISLSGYLTSPAGNLRISCRDSTSTGGVMEYNASGNACDCNISAFRIA